MTAPRSKIYSPSSAAPDAPGHRDDLREEPDTLHARISRWSFLVWSGGFVLLFMAIVWDLVRGLTGY